MRIIDLSLEIVDGDRPWPSHPKAFISEYMSHEATRPRFKPPCQGFASSQILLVDHFGTHMDAPFHFFPELPTTERVPLETLCGPAVLLDCSFKPNDEPVAVAHLEQAEREGAELRAGDIALVRCFAGTIGDPGWQECRGLSQPAAEWLRDRGVRTVGVDLGTVDDYTDMVRPAHLVLLREQIILMENLVLANLVGLDRKRFLFVGLPLKLRGATGSPIRAAALLDLPAL